MGLHLYISVLLLLLTSVHTSFGTQDGGLNQQRSNLQSLAVSRREVAARAKDDEAQLLVNKRSTENREFLQKDGLPLSDKSQLLLPVSPEDDTFNQDDGKGQKQHVNEHNLAVSRREVAAQGKSNDARLLVVVKRDTAGTDPNDGVGFPLNDGLPPPGQSQPLPPLTQNEDPSTQAPSMTVIQRQTTTGNVAPPIAASYICLFLCLITCHFLRRTI